MCAAQIRSGSEVWNFLVWTLLVMWKPTPILWDPTSILQPSLLHIWINSKALFMTGNLDKPHSSYRKCWKVAEGVHLKLASRRVGGDHRSLVGAFLPTVPGILPTSFLWANTEHLSYVEGLFAFSPQNHLFIFIACFSNRSVELSAFFPEALYVLGVLILSCKLQMSFSCFVIYILTLLLVPEFIFK